MIHTSFFGYYSGMKVRRMLNRYEKARIIGARALQIAMDAPVLIEDMNENDSIRIALAELEAGILPLTVVHIGD